MSQFMVPRIPCRPAVAAEFETVRSFLRKPLTSISRSSDQPLLVGLGETAISGSISHCARKSELSIPGNLVAVHCFSCFDVPGSRPS